MAEQAAFRHDLMGRIYHWLLHHAKYLGTYYTSVSSATLLLKTVPDTDPAPPDEPIVAGGAIAVGNVGPGRVPSRAAGRCRSEPSGRPPERRHEACSARVVR